MKNQKEWLNEFARKNSIVKPEDWGKLSLTQGQKKQFPSFFVNIYNGSLFKMLKGAYPGNFNYAINKIEIDWENELLHFMESRPKGYWESFHYQRHFFLQFAKNHNIKIPKDWGNFSVSEIKAKGGNVVIQKHNGSLLKALQFSFPGLHSMQ